MAHVLTEHVPELAEQTVPDSPAEYLALARQRFEERQASEELASKELGQDQGEAILAQVSVDLALKPYLE